MGGTFSIGRLSWVCSILVVMVFEKIFPTASLAAFTSFFAPPQKREGNAHRGTRNVEQIMASSRGTFKDLFYDHYRNHPVKVSLSGSGPLTHSH